MTYIESTTSPLASAQSLVGAKGAASNPVDDEALESPDETDDEDAEAREPSETLVDDLIAQVGDINLARNIDDTTLDAIGQAVMREYRLDDQSRADWLEGMQEAMQMALQKTEPKETPWANASNMIFPLIGKAALQFGTVAYPALIEGRSVVKGIVWGADQGTPATVDGKPDSTPKMQPGPDGQPQPVWLVQPGEKRKRAERIGEHMSWQLLSEMPEWEPQTDQMLHIIPITGGVVKKTYRDEVDRRNRSLMVPLQNLAWDYRAASFEDAPRHSELLTVYPDEIYTNEQFGRETEDDEGMWLHLDYGPAGGGETDVKRADGEPVESPGDDPDAPHVFIEQHRRWDLDNDGYPEPYIVTVHARSQKVVRIVARYDEDGILARPDRKGVVKITPAEIYTLVPFLPNLEGGSYPMGFGHYLRHLNAGINTSLNQMFDAATLQNTGAGFIGDQLGVPSGQVNFQVGKFVRVNTKGQDIRASVMKLPFDGPSPVLFQLLGLLMDAGKDIAGLQNVLSGDAAIANAPPTTILALIEQGMKLYTALHKRIYRALGAEFQKLYRLNRLHVKDAERYQVGDEWREIHPDDYRLGGGVEPVADPDMVTDMQKLGRSQLLLLFKDDPRMNGAEIIRRVLESANIDRADELFAPPNPMAQQTAAMEMALKQAELGRVRAAEQKDTTQAFLNLALARAKAAEPEVNWIESQLQMLRLHIEAVNAGVKAAAVDHRFHDTRTRGLVDHAKLAAAHASAGAGEGETPPAPPPAEAVVPPTPAPPSGELVNGGVPSQRDQNG